MLYCLASLPLIYCYSFSPRSELLGFINFFVINIVACFFDMVLVFLALFSQSQSSSAGTRVTPLTRMTNLIRWIIAVLFPSVNLKRSLFNIRLHTTEDCILAVNGIMLTDYSITEPWLSLREPGIGIQAVIFCAQILFWWIVLILIESGGSIKLGCRRCCGCDSDLQQDDDGNEFGRANADKWNDTVYIRFIYLSFSAC